MPLKIITLKQIKCFSFSILVFFLLGSCGSERADKNEIQRTSEGKREISDLTSGCYQLVIGKDTADLQIRITDTSVIGSLNYNRFEKDNNEGTIQGTIQNNLIKVWYVFSSEGVVSARELYLKKMDHGFAEGYGEVYLKNDSVYYRYPTVLRYEEKHLYLPINCKD